MQLNDKQIYKEMVHGELLFVGANPKFTFKKIIEELYTIKKYIRNNYNNDEHSVVNGEIYHAKILFETNNQYAAFECLKKQAQKY